VNWSIAQDPKSHGGLGIKDHTLMNLAMDTKIIWQLIIENYDWWKRFLLRKYFTDSRKRCLDSNYASKEGSPVWKLIKSTIPILQSKLSWDTRSRRMIEIWNGSIMGNPLIIANQELHPLKVWLNT
jgi:hypothetical protein